MNRPFGVPALAGPDLPAQGLRQAGRLKAGLQTTECRLSSWEGVRMGSWSVSRSERNKGLCTKQPTPDPSLEGNRRPPINRVAQPSRARVAAASRQQHEHRAGRPVHSQARTPALHPPGSSADMRRLFSISEFGIRNSDFPVRASLRRLLLRERFLETRCAQRMASRPSAAQPNRVMVLTMV